MKQRHSKLDGELIGALQPFIRHVRAIEAASIMLKESVVDWEKSAKYPFKECASQLRLVGFLEEAQDLESFVAKPKTDVIKWVLDTEKSAAQRIVNNASPSQIKRVSSCLTPGALRNCIEAVESGEQLTASEVKRRFGRDLSKLKDGAKRLKNADAPIKEAILKMLNSIPRK